RAPADGRHRRAHRVAVAVHHRGLAGLLTRPDYALRSFRQTGERPLAHGRREEGLAGATRCGNASRNQEGLDDRTCRSARLRSVARLLLLRSRLDRSGHLATADYCEHRATGDLEFPRTEGTTNRLRICIALYRRVHRADPMVASAGS